MMISGNLLMKTTIKTTLKMVEKVVEEVVGCLILIMMMMVLNKEYEGKQTWPMEMQME